MKILNVVDFLRICDVFAEIAGKPVDAETWLTLWDAAE